MKPDVVVVPEHTTPAGRRLVSEVGKPLSIGLLGTRGVPARYGGFETCVEEVGRRLAGRGHSVRVYSRSDSPSFAGGRIHQGMRIVPVWSLRLKAAETLSRSLIAAAHAVVNPVDVMFVFNAANTPVTPLLRARGIPFAIHLDGIESRRAKWGRTGRAFYRSQERLASRSPGEIIADSRGIQAYFRERYGREPRYIPYGAPKAPPARHELLAPLGLTPRGYHLVAARLEPENNAHLAVRAHAEGRLRHPLVIVGGAPYGATYIEGLRQAAAGSDIRFLGSVWDQAVMDELYRSCLTYVHGHSVGGTNPSLLRALGAAVPTLCYDVPYNREVAGEAADYFLSAADLTGLLGAVENDPEPFVERAERALPVIFERFNWERVTDAYEDLAYSLTHGVATPHS